MDIRGYCTIDRNAKSGIGENLETFIGEDCRVIEFAADGGVLVMNREASAIATFDKKDVYRKFECIETCHVVCPPGLNFVQQMFYVNKVTQRKGGYNVLLKNMVIQASLMKGKFTDDFLFAKEREEMAKAKRTTP